MIENIIYGVIFFVNFCLIFLSEYKVFKANKRIKECEKNLSIMEQKSGDLKRLQHS